MRSRKREEQRFAREQGTVGDQRAERHEQARLGAHSNVEVPVAKGQRSERRPKSEEEEEQPAVQLRRTARPGKPLKR